MSNEHLSRDTLVAYVMDHLGAADTERVEAHVAGCEQCSVALEQEAKLEIACLELATDLSNTSPRVVSTPAAWRAPLMGGLAAAAVAALGVAWQRSRPPVVPEPSATVSPAASRLPVTSTGAVAMPPPAATVTAGSSVGPTASAPTVLPPPSSSQPPVSGKCSAPVVGLVGALAIPQGDSGDIEIVLTNHPASCRYWADKQFEKSCDVWRTRITLPAESQKPGTYRVEQRFAYLDQRLSRSGGAWQKGSVCKMAGGNLSGKLRIEAVERDRIIGSICGSKTTYTPNPNLVDGRFVARRCPACAMTGDGCRQDADCCANACVQGRCIP